MPLEKEAFLRALAFQLAERHAHLSDGLEARADQILARLQAYVDAPLSKPKDPMS